MPVRHLRTGISLHARNNSHPKRLFCSSLSQPIAFVCTIAPVQIPLMPFFDEIDVTEHVPSEVKKPSISHGRDLKR